MVVEWLPVVAAGPGPPQPDPGASGEPVRRLHYPAGSVLVVAGIPGAGKTTLIERLFTGGAVTVLDSDTVRRRYARTVGVRVPYRLYRPLVHLAHYVRIARALSRPGSVVVHECGTRRLVRRWIARRAAREGRPFHLLFLDVTPEIARAGQRARRRLVRARSFHRRGGPGSGCGPGCSPRREPRRPGGTATRRAWCCPGRPPTRCAASGSTSISSAGPGPGYPAAPRRS